MERLVISIGREVGSGGRQIGKILANHFGIKYYDRELLSEAAVDMGFSEKVFEEVDENLNTGVLAALGELFCPSDDNALSGANLFKAQSETMIRIASKENCVIVGRCSDYILRNIPGLITIYLRADIDFRVRNIANRHNISESEAKDLIVKKESARKKYYDLYTGKSWGHCSGYDICLNVSSVGIENAAALVIDYIDRMQKK